MTETTGTTTRGTSDDPISRGIELAIERLRRHDMSASDDQVEHAEALARDYISHRISGAPPRAVELFAEQIALATIARLYNGEPELEYDEILEYEEACRQFINSFWHDPL